MSHDLKDLRAKVTPRTWCALEARARQSGKEKTEIVRDILDRWAVEEIHAATLLDALLRVEGEPGILEGGSGNQGAVSK